ncbi:MAG: type II secretion system protein [Kiritimatiellae bacterium]|nr:type II secretion system protein [Kiritimatiellia bacterium]
MKKNNGFTLVELLIVVGIIGVLMGLLSPAILKASKGAVNKSRKVEMTVLETALTEYHHDNKGWPIPAKPKQEGAVYGKNSAGVVDPAIIEYSGDKTKVVWNRLLKKGADSKYNSRKKDYIDISSMTAIKTYHKDNPRKNVEGDNVGRVRDLWGDDAEIKGPLVYWCDFIECPRCHEWSTNLEYCTNLQCPGRNGGKAFHFKRADKRIRHRGVMPYKIVFDLTSNVVYVKE